MIALSACWHSRCRRHAQRDRCSKAARMDDAIIAGFIFIAHAVAKVTSQPHLSAPAYRLLIYLMRSFLRCKPRHEILMSSLRYANVLMMSAETIVFQPIAWRQRQYACLGKRHLHVLGRDADGGYAGAAR